MSDGPEDWLPVLASARTALAAAEPVMVTAVRYAMTRYLTAVRDAVCHQDTTAVAVIVAAPEPPPNLDAWPPVAVWVAAVVDYLHAAVAATWRVGWADHLTDEQIVVVDDTAFLQAHLADVTARLTGATWPDEVYEAVRTQVVDSVTANETPGQLRKRIGEVLSVDPWESRVHTIARTEVHAAYSAGAYQAGVARAETFGEDLSRVWLATNDSRTRLAHEIANGMVAGPGEPFIVGGEPMRFPHDPLGSAGNTINCRCVAQWVDAAEGATARDLYQRYQSSRPTSEGPPAVTTAAASRVTTTANANPAPATTTAAATTITISNTPDVPAAAPPVAAQAPAAPADPAAPVAVATRWSGPLMALDHRTGDSGLLQRVIGIPAEGYQVTNHPWLSYQRASAPGHDGKIAVGRPEVLWVANEDLDGAPVPHLWGAGTLDGADPDAAELARKLRDGYAGTVSVDMDNAQAEIRWLNDAGEQVPDPGEDAFFEWLEGLDIGCSPVEYFFSWRFAGVTVLQDPAFHTGWVQCTDVDPADLAVGTAIWRLADTPALVAAAASPVVELAGMPGSVQWCRSVAQRAAVSDPSLDCFANPQLSGPTKVTVSDDGRRVFGHVADWDTVHAVFGCPPPPCPHGGSYPRFHRHPVPTADGTVVLTGPLTAGGHASTDEDVTLAAAQLHYDNPNFVIADVVAGEDQWGIWVSGALRPGVDPALVAFAHRYSFSGDWRDNMMIAACACSTPAFHLAHDPAVVSLVASAGPHRPRLAPARTRLRRHRDGSLAALVASGAVGSGPARTTGTRRPLNGRGPGLGWQLYRDMQSAAAIDSRLQAAAARVGVR